MGPEEEDPWRFPTAQNRSPCVLGWTPAPHTPCPGGSSLEPFRHPVPMGIPDLPSEPESQMSQTCWGFPALVSLSSWRPHTAPPLLHCRPSLPCPSEGRRRCCGRPGKAALDFGVNAPKHQMGTRVQPGEAGSAATEAART